MKTASRSSSPFLPFSLCYPVPMRSPPTPINRLGSQLVSLNMFKVVLVQSQTGSPPTLPIVQTMHPPFLQCVSHWHETTMRSLEVFKMLQ